ncbi:potassium channel family protein [Oribacterium sp. WCC10]|uniref:potassium channel family protein n=1 Tax=Oribacterium sp. WCC10 TaxID=1855343 RepID=UPI0008EC6A79|nr:TrkA family potassium uptake protein [Oribacterium sp. WCC10]SFG65717.1 trk system potassium uptake protein TrkA [Oribacterium sp. WCC10]
MKNVLIIGMGRFGYFTTKKLHELGMQVIAVDQDEEKVSSVIPFATRVLIGDCTSQSFLEGLGVNNFDLCIVAIGDNFLASLEITSLLKDLGARYVVARASGEKEEKFLLRNGADHVVFPEREMAGWTAIRFSSEQIKNYIDVTEGYAIFELTIPKDWQNKTVGQLNIRNQFGVNILGIRGVGATRGLAMDIAPDSVLPEGGTVLVLGPVNRIRKVFHL